jgi:hypothetical protein
LAPQQASSQAQHKSRKRLLDKVRIQPRGVYLILVESRNTQSDYEHFGVIDLIIEQAD